jgi:hypothetical protein
MLLNLVLVICETYDDLIVVTADTPLCLVSDLLVEVVQV